MLSKYASDQKMMGGSILYSETTGEKKKDTFTEKCYFFIMYGYFVYYE